LKEALDALHTQKASESLDAQRQMKQEATRNEELVLKIAALEREVHAEREGRMNAQIVANERAAHAHMSEASLSLHRHLLSP
jgi:hypothetical protein